MIVYTKLLRQRIVKKRFSVSEALNSSKSNKYVALIAQLGEHCTGIAEVVGSNPAQSLKIFSGLCSSSVTAALALMTVIKQVLFG